MIRRSHWATALVKLAVSSPVGVVVSTSRATTAQPLRRASSVMLAKSSTNRESRSSLATTRAPA